MKNTIARTINGLVTQTNVAIAGLTLHGAALGVTVVTPAGLTTAVGALNTRQNNCHAQKAELAVRSAALKQLLSDGKRQVRLGREVGKVHLGNAHSPAWAETGFVSSFEIPRDVTGMVPLLTALGAYFTSHPDQENEELNVTAADYTLLAGDLAGAHSAFQAQKATLAAAIKSRDEKADEIRSTLAALLKALGIPLDPMDDRYLAFGFNRPGQLSTPPMPGSVVATLIGQNAIAVKWAKTARAKYYRVWKKVVGVDDELIAVGTPGDLDFTIEGLPANATVEIAVSAVNNGGESVRTEAISVVTNAA